MKSSFKTGKKTAVKNVLPSNKPKTVAKNIKFGVTIANMPTNAKIELIAKLISSVINAPIEKIMPNLSKNFKNNIWTFQCLSESQSIDVVKKLNGAKINETNKTILVKKIKITVKPVQKAVLKTKDQKMTVSLPKVGPRKDSRKNRARLL